MKIRTEVKADDQTQWGEPLEQVIKVLNWVVRGFSQC